MSSPIIEEYRGIRGLVAAKLLTDTADALIYDTPFPIAGVATLTRTTENSTESHYYDNNAAIVIDGEGADTVKCGCSAIPLPVLAQLTGQYYDESTGTFVEGESARPYFGIGYITEDTAGNEVYVWRHKVKASIPDSSHNTKNNSTDANGQEIAFTGINTIHKFETTGKTAKAVNYNSVKGLISEADFFASVQTIDTIDALTPAVTSVTVTPTTTEVEVGDTVTLTATVAPSSVTTPVTWTTADNTRATVNSSGVVTGVAEGGVSIIASCGGKSAVCAVTVVPAT